MIIVNFKFMIQATVKSNKDGIISLSLNNGQSLNIPESTVTGSVKENDTINILFAAPGLEGQASKQLAKDLLNQLIKN